MHTCVTKQSRDETRTRSRLLAACIDQASDRAHSILQLHDNNRQSRPLTERSSVLPAAHRSRVQSAVRRTMLANRTSAIHAGRVTGATAATWATGATALCRGSRSPPTLGREHRDHPLAARCHAGDGTRRRRRRAARCAAPTGQAVRRTACPRCDEWAARSARASRNPMC
jgi:hypothetical protein